MNYKLFQVFQILLIIFLTHFDIFAQSSEDIASIGYRQYADANYKGFDNFLMEEGAWVVVNIPFILNEQEDALTPHLRYDFLQLNNDFYTDDQLDFHSFHVGLSLLKNWRNPHWSSHIEVGLSAASDFFNFNSNHLNYSANLLFFYGKSEDLVWSFGLDYAGGSFGNWIVPLFGVDWQINERLGLSFLSFAHLQLSQHMGERFTVGLQLENTAYSFNLPNYFGIEESTVYTFSDQFPFSPQKASFFLNYYLGEETVVFGKVGYEFARELFHTDSEGNFIEDSAYNGEIDAGLVFEVGFAWRVFEN